MGEPGRQFLAPWTYDCPQDPDVYHQLHAECRSIDRVAHRYQQPEPDVHNLHQHNWKEIDIDNDRLLSMARASVTSRQRPRSAHRSDVRHEYHSTREYGNQQQPRDGRQRIRPRSALSHRPDIEKVQQQRQFTRPQSAKPERECDISIDPNEFVQSLPQYLKDSKWTAMMQRGQSFRQSNLRRLEQETMELLQSVFRLEQPATLRNQSSTHVNHTNIQATAIACGSGLQLARTKKSQQQNPAASESEDSASPSKMKLKERRRVREKTKRRTKRKTDPGYMKQTECHAHRLEERLETTKKPSSVKKPISVKKQSRPPIDINAAAADPSRERVLQEMGWLFGDMPAFANGNTKLLKTRSQFGQQSERKGASSWKGASIQVDDDKDNQILAQDKQQTEPSQQTKQRQEAASLNGKAIGIFDASQSLQTITTNSAVLEVSLSNCQSNEVKAGAASSILSPKSDRQEGKCVEDVLVDSLELKEGIGDFEQAHEAVNAKHIDTDTESEPPPAKYRCHNVKNEDPEYLDTQPQRLMLQDSECLIPAAPESNADAIDTESLVRVIAPQVRPSDSAVHEPYEAGVVPSSPTSQHCEKDPMLSSEMSEPQSEAAEDHPTMKLDAQTQNAEDTHSDIAYSTTSDLRDTPSPSDGHAKEWFGEDIGNEDHGPAEDTVQDSEFCQSQSPHEQAVLVQADHRISQLAGDGTEKSLLVEDFISDSSKHDTPRIGDGWSSSDDGSVSELMKLCKMLATTPNSNCQPEPTIPFDVQNEISCPDQMESATPRTFREEYSSREQPPLRSHLEDALELPSASISSVIDGQSLLDEHSTRGNVHLRMEDLYSSDSSCVRSRSQAQGGSIGESGLHISVPSVEAHSAEGQMISSGNTYCNATPSGREFRYEAHDEGEVRLVSSSFDTTNDVDDTNLSLDSIGHGLNFCEVGSLGKSNPSQAASPSTVADHLVDVEHDYDISVSAVAEAIEHEFDADADNDAIERMEGPLQMTEMSSSMPDPATMSDDSTDLLVDADERSTVSNTHQQGEEDESVYESRDHVLSKIPTLDLREIAKIGESERVPVSDLSPAAVSSSHVIDPNSSNDIHNNVSGIISVASATEVFPADTIRHDIASSVSFIQNAIEIFDDPLYVEAIRDLSPVLENGSAPANLPPFIDYNLVGSLRSLHANLDDYLEPQEAIIDQDRLMRLAAQRIQKQYRCFIDRRLLIEQSKFLATKSHRQSRKKSRLEAKQLSLAPASEEPEPVVPFPCLLAIHEQTIPLEDQQGAGPSLSAMTNELETYAESEELIKLDYSSDDGDISMEVADPDAMLIEEAKAIDHLDDMELQPIEKDYFSEAFHTDSQTGTEMADIVPGRVSRLSLSLAAMAFDDANESAFFDTTSDPAALTISYPAQEALALIDPLSAGSKWERYIDTATQKSFYYHSELQISQWTPPNEPFEDKASSSQLAAIIRTKEAELQQNEEYDCAWSLRRNRSVSAAKWGDWQAFVDESTQQTFYYNAKTQESSWEIPVGFQYEGSQEPVAAPAESPWVMYVDEASGASYYVNVETNETTWDNPFDYVDSGAEQHQPTPEEDDYLIALDESSAEFYELG